MRQGFSLLELSIVLVIIGLLAGGVMTGQSLIHGAEMRSIVTEYSRYMTSLNTFRDKYQAIPGDMRNATAFWGKDNAACPTHTGTAATPGTCNGNGDGKPVEAGSAGSTNEMFQFWKQLALAGMIEGTYTGLAGPAAAGHGVIGTNVPASRYPQGGWSAYAMDYFAGNTVGYQMDYGNMFSFGGANPTAFTNYPLLKAEDAWNIDTKLDDGKPGYGKAIALFWDTCTTSSSFTDLAGTYDFTATGANCAIYFAKVF